jgi:hypothetical protein
MNAITARSATLAAVLGLASAGCAGVLDENSSCRDYLQAEQSEQDKAVSRVADKLDVKGVESPLIRPNIDYMCGNDPDATLGSAVRDSGQ